MLYVSMKVQESYFNDKINVSMKVQCVTRMILASVKINASHNEAHVYRSFKTC